uniref:Transmembrane protein 209 n=1 Tax=Mesocestoides corti TaxID=53468 RepID=A0A5K3FNW7_MESCO
MYGALQGLTKDETASTHGDTQVRLWRRSYDIPPPALGLTDSLSPEYDPRYNLLDKHILPKTECLKDTVKRVLPFWHDEIVPSIKVSVYIFHIYL